jgi:hypothetical protein
LSVAKKRKEHASSGSLMSPPVIPYAFINRPKTVWNSRWRGVSPFSCLSEYYRLIADGQVLEATGKS